MTRCKGWCHYHDLRKRRAGEGKTGERTTVEKTCHLLGHVERARKNRQGESSTVGEKVLMKSST